MGVLPKVTGQCEAELKKLVEQEPRKAGYSFSSWTCADLLHELIRKGFEAVSSETIRAHLHTLGYRVRRPVLSIASPDPEYRQKVKSLKKYQKQAKNGEILLYYQDEIDLNLLPGIMRCWTLEGAQRKCPHPVRTKNSMALAPSIMCPAKPCIALKNARTVLAFVLSSSSSCKLSPKHLIIMARRSL